MESEDFEELKQIQNGLISFHGFLSTSTKKHVASEFAEQSLSYGFPIAVLFRIKLNLTHNSCSYASLETLTANPSEYEVLLSLKNIFYIESIEKRKNKKFWQIDLTLFNIDDSQLSSYISIERNKFNHLVDYEKLGELLIEMNAFDKANDLYEINIPNDTDPKYTYVYCRLAFINKKLQKYDQAHFLYKRALQTKSNETLKDYVTISDIHSQIGEIFYAKNKLQEALEKFQCALEIQLEHLSSTHPSLVKTYDLIAMVNEQNGDYTTALDYREKQLDIQEKIPLLNQLDLALIHHKIAICLENLNRINEAKDHLQQSINMSNYDDPELNNRQTMFNRIQNQLESFH